MKIDWALWERWSEEALKLDEVFQGCGCTTDCDCTNKDMDKWLNDITYVRKFSPPPVKAVNRFGSLTLDKKGRLMGPYLYEEWKMISQKYLERFHEIIEGSKQPSWDNIWFRCPDDYYAGSYSHFLDISLIMIEKLHSDNEKHMAYSSIHSGVNIFRNIFPVPKEKAKKFREKGCMFTKNELNIENNFKNGLKINDSISNNICPKSEKTKKSSGELYKWGDLWYRSQKCIPALIDKQGNEHFPPLMQNKLLKDPNNRQFMIKTVGNWLKTGALFILNEKPLLSTPLVFANWDNPSKKKRLCFDGGCLKVLEAYKTPCVLEDLYKTVKILKKGDFLTKTDDKRGFHLLKMDRQSRPMVAFEIDGRYLAYRALPFGVPRAPGDFQRANMIAVNYARHHGVNCILYLDDRLFIDHQLINGHPRNCILGIMLILAMGGFIAIEKSDFIPTHQKEFLGMMLDCKKGTIKIPDYKLEKFHLRLNELIQKDVINLNELEKTRGKCVSFSLASPNMRLYIREMNDAIAQANIKGADKVFMNTFLKQELCEWIKMENITKESVWRKDIVSTMNKKFTLSFSDSSLFATGVVIVRNRTQFTTFTEYFTEDFQSAPIHVKEIYAILVMLEKCQNLEEKEILHFCDNLAVVYAFKNQGIRCKFTNRILKLIFEKLKTLKSDLKVYWISTKLQLADWESRSSDLNEEFIPQSDFWELENVLGIQFDIDAMASRQNRKLFFFFSRDPCIQQGQLGINFFTTSLEKFERFNFFIFPPKNIITQTIRFLLDQKIKSKVVLVLKIINEWPVGTQLLMREKNIYLYEYNLITIIPSENKLMYKGKMLAGKINTKANKTVIVTFNMQKIYHEKLKYISGGERKSGRLRAKIGKVTRLEI